MPSYESHPYFFELPSYPEAWEEIADEVLARQYWKRFRRKPFDQKNQYLVCYLMNRHKEAIFYLSRKYLGHQAQMEEFTHDLFEKLVKTLRQKRVRTHFKGWLLRVVKHMHLDRLHPNRVFVSMDELLPLAERDQIGRGLDLQFDYPLCSEKMDQLVACKVLSSLEAYVGQQILLGYKPRDIAQSASAQELRIPVHKVPKDPHEQFQQKILRVYSAADRLRKKLRKIA